MLFIPRKFVFSHSGEEAYIEQFAEHIELAIESTTDPVSGSPSKGKVVSGVICLHVGDMFCNGDKEFYSKVVAAVKRVYQIGSEDTAMQCTLGSVPIG